MPGGRTRKGKGNPRKSDMNPHRKAKLQAHHHKLKRKREKEKKEREERAEYWKKNKQWQEVDKPKLMKKLKKGSRLRRQLRKQGKLCACRNKNVTYLTIEKGKTIEKCMWCNKPMRVENEGPKKN